MADVLITTKTKKFPGGETTAYVLDEGTGTYRLTVVTRFDSGNYLTEVNEPALPPKEALGLSNFYTRE